MKDCLIALCILALVVGVTLGCSFYNSQTFSRLSDALDALPNELTKGDGMAKEIESIYNMWENKKKGIPLSHPHKKAEEVTCALIRLRESAVQENSLSYKIELECLRELCRDLEERGGFSWRAVI